MHIGQERGGWVVEHNFLLTCFIVCNRAFYVTAAGRFDDARTSALHGPEMPGPAQQNFNLQFLSLVFCIIQMTYLSFPSPNPAMHVSSRGTCFQ